MTDIVERWTGYNEQSWQQRFETLDRRFHADNGRLVHQAREITTLRAEVEKLPEGLLAELETYSEDGTYKIRLIVLAADRIAALQEAICLIRRDYWTSDEHHPEHVVVVKRHFDALITLLETNHAKESGL